MPLSIGLILTVVGLWYLYKNSYKKAKIFLTLGFAWTFLIAYQPISKSMLNSLNNQNQYLATISKDIKYILLLGGDMQLRGWEALRLYNKIPNAKIITSGYEGSFDVSEAKLSARILMESGVAKKDIITQATPRNTKEEAIAVKKLIGSKPFYLVTASYHMLRALALFRKEGLNPIPAPTFVRSNKISFLLPPSCLTMKDTEIAWHEYLGMIWAKLRGQI